MNEYAARNLLAETLNSEQLEALAILMKATDATDELSTTLYEGLMVGRRRADADLFVDTFIGATE
ncbi:MAG TPA: hypothetical protein VNQ48_02580 [Microbacteriaceae bacterium]|nr:hypothetical protein [Microbacteriaceae bacterium]